MAHDFWPDNEFDMLGFSQRFLATVGVDPPAYGLTAEQVAQAQDALDAFGVSYRKAKSTNRGSVDVARKNMDKRFLEKTIRPLARIVSAQPWLDEPQRKVLGLSIAPPVSPRVGAPAEAPKLYLRPRGRGAQIRLCDEAGRTLRGRPRGVKGAMIFFGVSDSPYATPRQWHFIEITAKTNLRITLPREVDAGSVVFFNACWLSPTLERGPMSESPRSIRVMDGMGAASRVMKAA